MDPDVVLNKIRLAVWKALHEDSEKLDTGEAIEAFQAMEDLDDWLTRGGFLPQEWALAANPQQDAPKDSP